MNKKAVIKPVLTQIERYRFLVALLLFAGIWLYIFLSSDIFSAGFNYFLDDHQIFENHRPGTGLYRVFVDPFTTLFVDIPSARFRPLYDVLLRLFSQLYGLNPFLWYVSSLVVAVLTTTNFYLFARLLSFPFLESLCFALLIVLGEQASTYGRFGTPETTSTFLLSLAFIFGSLGSSQRGQQRAFVNFMFVFAAILAALNKEACILMLPAFAFLKIWLFSRQTKLSLRQSLILNRVVIYSLLGAFALFLAYIKLAGVSGPGYAGINKDSFSIISLVRVTSSLSQKSSLVPAVLINIIYCFQISIYRKKLKAGIDGYFYIFIALLVVPQLILYSKSGMHAHYLLPCVIGVSLLTVYPLVELQKNISNKYKILLVLVVMIIANLFAVTLKDFADRSRYLHNQQAMVKDISSCIGGDGSLIIVGNPYIHYERLYGFKNVIFDKIVRPRRDSLVLATYGSSKTNLKSDVAKNDEVPMLFLNPRDVEKWYNNNTIDKVSQKHLRTSRAVVILGYDKFKTDFERLASYWFNATQFRFAYYPDIDIGFYCKKPD